MEMNLDLKAKGFSLCVALGKNPSKAQYFHLQTREGTNLFLPACHIVLRTKRHNRDERDV